jgi:hypothetical protein
MEIISLHLPEGFKERIRRAQYLDGARSRTAWIVDVIRRALDESEEPGDPVQIAKSAVAAASRELARAASSLDAAAVTPQAAAATAPSMPHLTPPENGSESGI